MHFSIIEIPDLFIRAAAVGQLMLICVIYLRQPITGQKLSLLGVAACTAAYLLLTAPIPDSNYGLARNILLVFTDALGYVVWLSALYYFNDNVAPQRLPAAIKIALGLFALWYLYFFGVLEGRGVFHDINHAIAIALLLHVIYVAMQGLSNDLVDSRRKTRVLIAVLISGYGILIALAEFATSAFRHHWLFSLSNAVFIFLAIALLARHLLNHHPTEFPERRDAQSPEKPQAASVSPEFAPLKQNLDKFMADGGYRRSGLSIRQMAEQLECPEHQLRRLINTVLGFRNFSAFLNRQRLQDACEKLRAPEHLNTPILTIALELGYGSIGPFNRAFKAEMDETPSEYRSRFRNRP